jgi:hypothetical protein
MGGIVTAFLEKSETPSMISRDGQPGFTQLYNAHPRNHSDCDTTRLCLDRQAQCMFLPPGRSMDPPIAVANSIPKLNLPIQNRDKFDSRNDSNNLVKFPELVKNNQID